MGTRADFYVGRGENAEWLGSIAWDGYPEGIPNTILAQHNEAVYRLEVGLFLGDRNDATLPEMGWPWPWDDSRTTDYAYAFDDGVVYAASYGGMWFVATEPEPEYDGPDLCVFPDMTHIQNVSLGSRSGLTIVGRRDDGSVGIINED